MRKKSNKKLEISLDLLEQKYIDELKIKTGKTEKEIIKAALAMFYERTTAPTPIQYVYVPIGQVAPIPSYPITISPISPISPIVPSPQHPLYPTSPIWIGPTPMPIDPLIPYCGDVFPDDHVTTCKVQS